MTRYLPADRQGRIGLALASGIVAAWLAIHFGGIFFWRWTPSRALAAVPLVLFQAWLSAGLFIVAHDAMHGSLAPGRPKLNRAIGTLCLGIYAGLSYRALAPKHAAHHRAPGTAGDPDCHPTGAPAVGRWFLAFFGGYYSHGQLLRIALVAAAYLLLGASLINILVFWAAPALIALAQLFVFGTYLPHRAGTGFPDEHRARSVRSGPVASLLTCFHFGGYHHEHHLFPATPWWALPRTRPA